MDKCPKCQSVKGFDWSGLFTYKCWNCSHEIEGGYTCPDCNDREAWLVEITQEQYEESYEVWKTDKDGEEYPSHKTRWKTAPYLHFRCEACGNEWEEWEEE